MPRQVERVWVRVPEWREGSEEGWETVGSEEGAALEEAIMGLGLEGADERSLCSGPRGLRIPSVGPYTYRTTPQVHGYAAPGSATRNNGLSNS